MTKDFSKQEIRLFHSLGIADLMEHLEAVPLYRLAVEQAFLKGRVGPNIDALRRGANAILASGRPYRMTKEFDELISWLPLD